jgi:hypothetical protein
MLWVMEDFVRVLIMRVLVFARKGGGGVLQVRVEPDDPGGDGGGDFRIGVPEFSVVVRARVREIFILPGE